MDVLSPNHYLFILFYYLFVNHNYNKILKSDWLSTALISALIGQYASCVKNKADLATEREGRLTVVCANQTTGLTKG